MLNENEEEEAPADFSPEVLFPGSFHIQMSCETTHHRLRVCREDSYFVRPRLVKRRKESAGVLPAEGRTLVLPPQPSNPCPDVRRTIKALLEVSLLPSENKKKTGGF